ncbi:hypothetical protein JCM10450v2_007134 [Rhodotorula kratochvilovae]
MAPAASLSLDDLVSVILGTSPPDVPQLIAQLKKLDKAPSASAPGSSARRSDRDRDRAEGSSAGADGVAAEGAHAHVLEGRTKDGQDPLALLDPQANTVGFLYILNARLAASKPRLEVLVPYVQAWVDRCDVEQARLVPEQVYYLAQQLCVLSDHAGQPALPVQPLATLLARFPYEGYLTSLHPLFLRVIMGSGMYGAARELLMHDITDVDKQLYPVKYQDHLLYHYLGGTILALLGEYTRAAELLEICVSAPGPSVSLIQLDAYKKLVLVQLLAFSKTQPLPKYTTGAFSTAAKALCVPYTDYAAAFVTLDRARLAGAAEKGREAFEKDHNSGLVFLVEQSLRRRQIQKLTETYITLSLGEIATYVGHDAADEAQLKEVEREVREMIATKQIFATLSPSPSSPPLAATTVSFTDDPEPYLTPETVVRVTRAIETAQALERRWAGEAERMEESKDFVQKAWLAAATPAGTSAASGGFAGFGGGFSDEFDYAATGGSPGGGGEWGEGGGMGEDSE